PDHATGSAHGDMVKPARRHAQMLREADRSVGRQGEARDAHAIDLVFGDARTAYQGTKSAAQPPMGTFHRIPNVRYGDRGGHDHPVVGLPRHATGSCRFFISRVSKHRLLPGKVAARVFSSPRWILFVAVRGRASTKA